MSDRIASLLTSKLLVPVSLLLFSGGLFAADVLFVSDSDNDENMATVLSGDGHNVTVVLNDYVDDVSEDNVVLQGDLSAYACIVWAASGEGSGDDHNATTTGNLSTFVSNGGTVFVTGYDSIASPTDEELIAFVGGEDSEDSSGDNDTGPVTGINILSTGLIDIVGVTPTGGYDDSDALVDPLPDTDCVALRTGESSGDCAWSVRSLGLGQIAYVSNGEDDGEDHGSWDDTSPGGDGAYNAALRNFAFNCGAPIAGSPATAVPTLSGWSTAILAGILALFAGIILRRRIAS
ncbi:MAG: IPTL-CTERM sorting domain-containing protein [Lysobacterales bacterium]